ncbi:MAG: hypothetical protein LBO20_09535 [Bifidobacteriaceae bacterium]|jgi:predicted nucleic acid-binding protein|nr:hypothetical protein [Bifidobacteriaceae bacterium]
MLVCDTGPLVAAVLSDDPNHGACVELLRRAANRGPAVAAPATVLADAGFLIERSAGPEVEAAFLDGFASPGFEVIALTSSDFARMAELVRQVATLDRRHFFVVRPARTPGPRLLPH